MSKTALIVDDSPLARHVLGQLLAEYELTADAAPSAEAALEYLKQRRPDVIFMDHLMPGMDGFEALEAIKANPATATIPVMMYTSQEGELYVGQARALGAFGVLPKELKPVEVARVLTALHLLPEQGESDRKPDHESQSADATDSHRVKELLEELFYQQRSALREEIREGYQRALASTHTQIKAATPLVAPPPPSLSKRAGVAGIAAATLGILALTFAFLYFTANRLAQQTAERSTQLIASTARLNSASAQALGAQAAAAPPPGDTTLVGALEWAVNLDGSYPFDGVPLDDNRAQIVGQLVQYLNRAGFSGTIALEVHVGRFCTTYGVDGNPELAPEEQPAATCDQVGWSSGEASALGRRQTLTFANTVATATQDTGIEVQTTSFGSERPVIEYPPLSTYVTAGEWNRTAASNHRIDVRLIADAESDVSRTDLR
jgi:CheY-like chemotaxis protein